MGLLEVSTFVIYFVLLLAIVFLSYRKQKSDTYYVLGNRSLNFWLTALSAHASDMSSWLFMGYPALIFVTGIFNIWTAIGLVGFMFLNWHFVAPKVRAATEKMNNLTLNSYFETRFKDTSGILRTISAIMSFIYYLIYISSGLYALGLIVESLFGLSFIVGITIGLLIVLFYVFLGGYVTVAWIDLFQGFFLLAVILFIPSFLLVKINGFAPIISALDIKNLSTSLFPNFKVATLLNILFLSAGWGLGYLGQPHIITKFMGIKKTSDMPKAKYLGISWQILALGGATLIALIGIFLFPQGIADSQLISLEVVKLTLPPFFAALVLCAILAATTNVMAAQILVVASTIGEDFYKGLFFKKATHKETLLVSKISVIFIGLLAYLIAFFKISTIYSQVLYAWSGLGASFGPLLLISLYSKKVNRIGAFFGILTGGIVSGIWPYFNKMMPMEIPPLIPGFLLSCLAIFIFSFAKEKKQLQPKKK